MAAPTINTHSGAQYNSSGGTKNFTVTRGANSEALVVLYTFRYTGGADTTVSASYGGVAMTKQVQTTTGDGTSFACVFVLTDFSSVSGSTLSVVVPGAAGVALVYYALLDHSGPIVVLDDGTDNAGDASINLNSGMVDGLGFICGTAGVEMTSGGGQTVLYDNDFFGPYHMEGSYEAITGSGSMSQSAGGNDVAAAAVLMGGNDSLYVLSTRIEVEVGLVSGFSMDAPADVVIQPARIEIEVGLNTGFAMVSTGPRQVMLVPIDQPEETTSVTEGGTEGQVLTFHEAEQPTWEDAVAGLEVAEADGAPDVADVSRIEFDGATVTDDGGGQVTVTVGAQLTVEELDADPSVSPVDTLIFPDGSVTDNGDGSVYINQLPTGAVGCKVYRNQTTSVLNTTTTEILFDSEDWDTDGFHSTVSATGRATIPAGKAGKYLAIFETGRWDGNTTGTRNAWISKNGSAISDSLNAPDATGGPNVTVAVLVDLVAGDYLQCFVWQPSGGTRTLGAAAGSYYAQSKFSLILIGSGAMGGGYGAAVRRAATQSVANAAFSPWTYFSWDTELLDTHAFWSAGDPTKLVAQQAGTYISGNYWQHDGSSATATDTIIGIEHYNSSNVLQRGLSHRYESRHAQNGSFTSVFKMAAGDYLKHFVYHTTGATRNATGFGWISRIDASTSGGGISEGAAFPVGVASGFRFWRTDLGIAFYYDGTRWVSETLYQGWIGTPDLPSGSSTSAVLHLVGPGPMGGLDWYVYKVEYGVRVLSTNNGSNYWFFDTYKATAASETAIGSTVNTSAISAGNRETLTVTVNAVVASGIEWIETVGQKTGAPGALYITALVTYRLTTT